MVFPDGGGDGRPNSSVAPSQYTRLSNWNECSSGNKLLAWSGKSKVLAHSYAVDKRSARLIGEVEFEVRAVSFMISAIEERGDIPLTILEMMVKREDVFSNLLSFISFEFRVWMKRKNIRFSASGFRSSERF